MFELWGEVRVEVAGNLERSSVNLILSRLVVLLLFTGLVAAYVVVFPRIKGP